MMKHNWLWLLVILLVYQATPSLADYGWIPKYQNLFIRIGAEFYTTNENFDVNGYTSNFRYQSQLVDLSEIRFSVEPEYGFAEDWSFYLKGTYVQASVTPKSGGETVLSANGIESIWSGVKWNFMKKFPSLTLEALVKVPTASSENLQQNELMIGDGNFDLGLTLHSGLTLDKFFFALSPGILWRFGFFASALTIRGALGARVGDFYGLIAGDLYISLNDTFHFNSSLTRADAIGSGGSFSRLAESPNTFVFGPKLGFRIVNNYYIEAYLKHSLSGSRAPRFLSYGINFFAAFNFYEEEKKTKIREVPFDAPIDQYKTEEDY